MSDTHFPHKGLQRPVLPLLLNTILASTISVLGFFFLSAVNLARLEAVVEERTADVYTSEQAKVFAGYIADSLARVQLMQDKQAEELLRAQISNAELRARIQAIEQELQNIVDRKPAKSISF